MGFLVDWRGRVGSFRPSRKRAARSAYQVIPLGTTASIGALRMATVSRAGDVAPVIELTKELIGAHLE
jgi:hypothetical protein